jgi:hypothetical protein
MFSRREKDHELYENYNQDSDGCHCCHCDTGCCAGIKSVFNKIRHRFIKPKNKNKNLNSKLLLGDDY